MPKPLPTIAPVRGNTMMMPTILGTKSMCIKPSLACGAYINPRGRCREPYLYKKSSKVQQKEPPKEEPPKAEPPKDRCECVCPPLKTYNHPGAKQAKPIGAPPIETKASKAKPRNRPAKQPGAQCSPGSKTVDVSGCCTVKPASPDLPSEAFPCKVSITHTGKEKAQPQQKAQPQPQQQVQPKQLCSPLSGPVRICDYDKPLCESPRNLKKQSADECVDQQAVQQSNPKASPVCSPAQIKQQSPGGSSQKDLLTISINCSVSEKTNSMQLCVSENPKVEEKRRETE
ncbi:hypothetical protein Aperf_G00000125156 [Anoplocephala perfoliata]